MRLSEVLEEGFRLSMYGVFSFFSFSNASEGWRMQLGVDGLAVAVDTVDGAAEKEAIQKEKGLSSTLPFSAVQSHHLQGRRRRRA